MSENCRTDIDNEIYTFKLFNPDGDDSNETTRLINSNNTGINNFNNEKYKSINNLYEVLEGIRWLPNEVSYTKDSIQYKDLNQFERNTFDSYLSYLSFLDSVQSRNLCLLNRYVTSPEIFSLITLHQYQEINHSKSYQHNIESIIPVHRRNEIYELWRKNKPLLERNKYVGDLYKRFDDKPNKENFFKSLVADLFLEGLYFYNGFNFFYSLASQGKMLNTVDMIKFIHRDENQHIPIFINLIKIWRKENPKYYSSDYIIESLNEAIQQDISWVLESTQEQIFGFNKEAITNYSYYLGNSLLSRLGIKYSFGSYINSYKHLEAIANIDNNGQNRGNFFESTVSSYNENIVITDFDSLRESKSRK